MGSQDSSQLIWLITGTSSSFGTELVDIALARGDKVIATARSVKRLADLPKTPNVRLMELDVTAGSDVIIRKINDVVTWFGRIDVLVNNAGIAARAIAEEGGSQIFMENAKINVLGALDVTNAVLPHMRARKSGTIVMIGSRSSWKSEVETLAYYSSTKAALRVLGETLAYELDQFSIRVLIAEPAGFRTWSPNFLNPSITPVKIPDHNPMREGSEKKVAAMHGRQPGDPRKAMELVVDVVRGEGNAKSLLEKHGWPLYLPIGKEAEDAIREKTQKIEHVLDVWGDLIRDTRLDEEAT